MDTGPRTIGFKLDGPCGNFMARYGATALVPDTWYHVAGVYDADTRTLDVYLNGHIDNGPLIGPVDRCAWAFQLPCLCRSTSRLERVRICRTY